MQDLHGGGPVGWLWQTVPQLDWRWPSFATMLDDWGTRLLWLDEPQGMLQHMLRASQRRSLLRRIRTTRNDLGSIAAVKQGIDYYATTWLQRTQGRAKCNAWQLGSLVNYLCGGDHTQQRRSRSTTSADPSPLCRYCSREEETQEHTIWRCPCWQPQRTALATMISPEQWRALPQHTRHCGL